MTIEMAAHILCAVLYAVTGGAFFVMYEELCPNEPSYKWKALFLWPVMTVVMVCAYAYIRVTERR